jgi:antitoxin component of MazEF toxin-antitoxin module
MDKAKPYQLKRVGGSMVIVLPPPFIHANNLRFGDYVIVDLSKFRCLKAEDFELLGRELEPAPQDAA